MNIRQFPMHAADDAALDKKVSAWAIAIREGLKAKFGTRFTVDWTDYWSPNPAGGGPAGRDYRQSIAVAENGRPYARIDLLSPAAAPRTLACAVETVGKPFELGAKVMTAVGVMAGIAAFCGWVYWSFFEGGFGRAWARLITFGRCAGCANKLEVFFVLFTGWLAMPVMAGFACVFVGTAFDERVERVLDWGRRRKLNRVLVPWLTELLRELEGKAAADYQAGQDFGTAPMAHAAAGTPHHVHPNIVWNGNGNIRPADGYMWASDDTASFAVKPKPDAASVVHAPAGTPHPVHPNVVWDGNGKMRAADGYMWASDDTAIFAVKPKPESAMVHAAAGTPHPVHSNVVWDGNGNMRAADGYMWASDDTASFSVKPKADAAPVVHALAGTPHPVHPNVLWDGNGRTRPADGYMWASDDTASFAVTPKPGPADS